MDLREYIGTGPSFLKYWNFTQQPGNPKLYTAEMKESRRLDVLFEKDRLMWCLYLVTLPPSEQEEDDIPLVLKHLDEYLDRCSRAEAGRINSVMYRSISELTVLHGLKRVPHPSQKDNRNSRRRQYFRYCAKGR